MHNNSELWNISLSWSLLQGLLTYFQVSRFFIYWNIVSNIQITERQASQEPEGSNAKRTNIGPEKNDKNEKDNNGKEKEITTVDS